MCWGVMLLLLIKYIYIQCIEKNMSFNELISKRIPVQISSHYDSVFLDRSSFDV